MDETSSVQRHSCLKENALANASPSSSSGSLDAVASSGHRIDGSEHGHAAATKAPPVMLCACLRPAASFIANTASNRNRTFLRCGNPARQMIRCNCFFGIQGCFLWIWEDLLNRYANAVASQRTIRFKELLKEHEDRAAASATKIANMEEELGVAGRLIAAAESASEQHEARCKAAKSTVRVQKILIVILVFIIIARIAS